MARYDAQELRRFANEALRAVHSPAAEAEVVADCLVGADERGIHSHGMLRLGLYIDAVRAGGIVPGARMNWVSEAPAVAVLDANHGFGHPALLRAIDRAERMAREAGVATVTVRRSSHYGAGAYWADEVTRRGLICMLLSNTGPCVAPFGSREGLLGTNPITLGVPVPGDGPPVIADMATAIVAYGKLVAHESDGAPIPEDWALDAEGVPTTDPTAARSGALKPVGAHKGSGLSVFVELMTGGLSGSNFSYEAVDMQNDFSSRMSVGHTLTVWDPAAFGATDDFGARVDALTSTLAGSETAVGFDRVRLPGEVEHERMAEHGRTGITLPAAVPDDFQRLAELLDVKPAQPREQGSPS